MDSHDLHPLEQRVRTMLSERAGDVTPDPATWQVVERRTRRRGAGLSLALAGVAAALVACALVVVPALSRGPEIRFEAGAPPSAPAEQPAPRRAVPSEGSGDGAPATLGVPAPALPSAALLLTDGSSVLRTDGAGRVEEVLWQGDDTVHCTDGACDDRPYVAHLDLRPGSRPDDLVVVYGWSGCGALSWGRATTVDGEVVLGGGGVPSGATCPVDAAFAPEGDALAVLDSDGAAWRIHLQRWTDEGPSAEVPEQEGPGTGDPPGIGDLRDLAGWSDVRIADWRWTEEPPDGGRRGEIVLVGTREGERAAAVVAVEIGPDGAIAVADGATPQPADPVTLGAAGPYRLVAGDDGPRLVTDGLPDLTLPDLALPDPALPDAVAGGGPWVAAGEAGTVLVGDGVRRAWAVRRVDGGWSAPVELPGPVTAGDVLASQTPFPPGASTPAPPAAAPPPGSSPPAG